MVDEEVKKDEEQQQEKKKKSILQNRMVIVGIILIGQLAIAMVIGNMMVANSNKQQEAAAAEAVEEDCRGMIISIEDIVVNLKDRDKLYFLKVTIGLEVEGSAMQKEIEKREPQLRDIVIATLSGMSVQELDTQEKRNALKSELHRTLSSSLASGDLIQVYFSDFVIQ